MLARLLPLPACTEPRCIVKIVRLSVAQHALPVAVRLSRSRAGTKRCDRRLSHSSEHTVGRHGTLQIQIRRGPGCTSAHAARSALALKVSASRAAGPCRLLAGFEGQAPQSLDS